MAFRVGQDVVCLRDWPPNPKVTYSGPLPVKGGVYTIREIVVDSWCSGDTCLRLEEIILPLNQMLGEELAFEACYFRPIARRNIEIVEALKAPPPEQVEPLSPLEVAFQ